MSAVAKANSNINLRAPKATKDLIDRAADALGKKRTEFMLETLREKSHEVLADRTQFRLSARQMHTFNTLLDEPVSEAVLLMLTKRAPWER